MVSSKGAQTAGKPKVDQAENERLKKFNEQSNVATAHPIAAELRGMTVPSLCSFVVIENPKVSFGHNLPFLQVYLASQHIFV